MGGFGGSGIVVARYLGDQRASGGIVTTSGGNTIHTFTSSGSFYTGFGIAKATGGNIYTDGTYWYHAFRSASGTFAPTQSLTADILVVAGGGGGGFASTQTGRGGGGGAGGLLFFY